MNIAVFLGLMGKNSAVVLKEIVHIQRSVIEKFLTSPRLQSKG